MAESKVYTEDLQRLFLEIMIDNPDLFVRVQNIYNPENFSRSLFEAAKFIGEYSRKHSKLPAFNQINVVCETELKSAGVISTEHQDWFLSEFEGFSKQKELNRAILKAADLIDKGETSTIEKLIKDAVQIGLVKDLGTDYFADPRARLLAIKSSNGQVSTGWANLDAKLFGGMSRGELNIFVGGSGSGKSLFLQNLSVNWTTAGLNGIYLTLELSENMSSLRIDSMVTNCNTKEVFRKLDEVELKVKMVGKASGKFQLKYMPAQSNVNDIRAYIREYQIQYGIKVDYLMVDYLDLLMPVSVKVNPSDLFIKDKYVSEELRNLAKELNVLLVTAAQFNRSAVDEVEFNHAHISGGISKINTADNVFGIYTSRSLKEQGRYQLQLLKTRTSSGVGQRVDLDFNVETLRITDADLDEQSSSSSSPNNQRSQSAIQQVAALKAKATTTAKKEVIDPEIGEIIKVPQATSEASILRQALANLKKPS
jgi:archaellum biogenesis ATPase FlaH